MTEKKTLLEIRDLCIEFRDQLLPETVVKDLNLSLKEGEITGIVGESGSGKSMTALAIAGLLNRHDMEKRGQILFDGVDLLTCERARLRQYQGKDIGIIFQEPMTSLNPVRRIGWQVEESLRLHTSLTKEEQKRRAMEALHQAELADAEKVYGMYPHELSGGMRQRVMIAAAMVCRPRLLIADEPSTALDVTIQEQILRLLKRINKESGVTVLFISHDLSLVRRLCERVAVMQEGRIVEMGEAETVFTHPREAYTKRLVAAIPRCAKRPESQQAPLRPDETEILRVEGLSVSYREKEGRLWRQGKERLPAVRDVSFVMKRGEILGLVGESGCGKTTLVKAVLGMVKAQSGRIVHTSEGPQMIFQDPYGSLNPVKKVGSILEEPLRIKGGFTKKERRERVAQMLRLTGLDEKFADRYPSQLSGGQRQRVSVACALMLSPGLLIADEPLSALDVTVQAQIMELLLKLHGEMGLSVLFISHDLRVVYRMCGRVLIMKEGRIVEQGDTQKVYFAPEQEYTKALLKASGVLENSAGKVWV